MVSRGVESQSGATSGERSVGSRDTRAYGSVRIARDEETIPCASNTIREQFGFASVRGEVCEPNAVLVARLGEPAASGRARFRATPTIQPQKVPTHPDQRGEKTNSLLDDRSALESFLYQQQHYSPSALKQGFRSSSTSATGGVTVPHPFFEVELGGWRFPGSAL